MLQKAYYINKPQQAMELFTNSSNYVKVLLGLVYEHNDAVSKISRLRTEKHEGDSWRFSNASIRGGETEPVGDRELNLLVQQKRNKLKAIKALCEPVNYMLHREYSSRIEAITPKAIKNNNQQAHHTSKYNLRMDGGWFRPEGGVFRITQKALFMFSAFASEEEAQRLALDLIIRGD